MRQYQGSFSYQARTWDKPRRVVAKVAWHPGELYPRVGFIVTNLGRPAVGVVAFYNQRCRGTKITANPEEAGKWAEDVGWSRGCGAILGPIERQKIIANPASESA